MAAAACEISAELLHRLGDGGSGYLVSPNASVRRASAALRRSGLGPAQARALVPHFGDPEWEYFSSRAALHWTPGPTSPESSYQSLGAFLDRMSGGRFFLSKAPEELLPRRPLDEEKGRCLHARFEALDGDLLQISPSGFWAKDRAGAPVMCQVRGEPRASALPRALQIGHHLIRWCSSAPGFPPELRRKPVSPPTEYAITVTARLVSRAADHRARALKKGAPALVYRFYMDELLPAVAEHLEDLAQAIHHAAPAPPSEGGAPAPPGGEEADCCPICQDPCSDSDPRPWSCPHVIHAPCLAQSRAHGLRTCPVCRGR
jgi:hypothetical protein